MGIMPNQQVRKCKFLGFFGGVDGVTVLWLVTWPQTPTRMVTSLGNIHRVHLIF